MTKRKEVNIRIDVETRKRLKIAAIKRGVSLKEIIRQLAAKV